MSATELAEKHMTTDELNQLRDLLETLENGEIQVAIEWLRAAIKGEEKRQGNVCERKRR